MTDTGKPVDDLSAAQRRELLASLLGRDSVRVCAASHAQRRMWFLDRMGSGAAYNLPNAFRMRGALDVGALEQAITAIVARHETLRTTFAAEGGVPRQVITAKAAVPLRVEDVSGEPAAQREEAARRAVALEAGTPFDLATGPLLRALLVRLGAEDHVLLVTAHHIVSDGWSQGIFRRELAEHYRALRAGEPPRVPELPLQYAEFARRQDEWLRSERMEQQLRYWRQQLAPPLPVLDLPTDRPRPAVQTFGGAALAYQLPAPLSDGLLELARRHGATPAMLLLAVYQLLLSRYSGQADVVVGSPIANRNKPEIENLIGFFVNTLVFRSDLGGDPKFTDLLARVRDISLGAYENQDVPFERLVDELAPGRDLSHSPMMQALFAFQNVGVAPLQLPGLEVEAYQHGALTTRFDLECYFSQGPNGLGGRIVYNPDLFDAATVQRMQRHLQALLASVVADPEAPLSRHRMLTDDERRERIAAGRGEVTDYPRQATVHGLFAAIAAQQPDAVAVEFQGEQLNYGELARRANRLAHHLIARGVGPEVLVGLAVERSLEMVVGILGILQAGGAYVPLDPSYPTARLEFMLRETAAPVVLTQAHLVEQLPDIDGEVVRLDADAAAIAAQPDAPLPAAVDATSLAYVMYTSGSTGKPKGACITHRSVVRLVRDTNYLIAGPDDVFLQLAPISFDAATLELWGSLLNGGKLVVFPPHVPTLDEIGDAVEQHGVTTLWLTGALFQQVVDARLEQLAGVRQLLAGGDVLSVPHVRRVIERLGEDGRIINGYGPTENTTFTCCHVMRPGATFAASVPIGTPIANTTAHVLDDSLQPVPVGVPGELYTGGDGIARGYLGDAALTAERLLPDPFAAEAGARMYRTGDRVRWLQSGVLEFLGRADAQTKVRGFRIEPGEVEAALFETPGVRDATVVGRADRNGNKQLVAYVVPEEGHTLAATELRAALVERLPGHMVPSAFVSLDALPLSPNGKVDRRALPAPEVDASAEYAAPRDGREELLCEIWSDVLGVERVGIHDDFFELGGHSLLATQVVSRIRDALKVEIPLRVFFDGATIAALAARVRDSASAGSTPIVAAERAGPPALSFAQRRLWFLDQLGAGTAYNVPMAFRLEGGLDAGALQRSLQAIVDRHEVLRTSFPARDGEPVQAIAEQLPIELVRLDLTALPADERAAEIGRLRQQDESTPFDLATGPVLRATLVAVGERQHVLLLDIHHVAFDGWSVGVLHRELTAHYRALAAGEPPALPPLAVQYADFARWQEEWMATPGFAAQVDYWRQQLAGLEPLDLPTDHTRPADQTFRGAAHDFALGAPLSRSIKELGKRSGVTPAMALLAGFVVVLSRYSGQDDVAVGSPIANRTRREVEDLIGFFVNTLVLRTDVSGDPSFGALLARVQRTSLEAYDHQDVPFERLVDELGVQRDLSRSPLFQVLFAMQNAPAPGVDVPGLTMRYIERETPQTRFDLELHHFDSADGLRGRFIYNTDLFEAATIERLAGHLQRFLAAAVADPGAPLSSLSMLTDEERRRICVEWNATARQGLDRGTVHGIVAEQVQRTPDAIAVRDGDHELDYATLEKNACQLAHELIARGVGVDGRVAILLTRSAAVVTALYAVLKAGAAYVPLDPGLPGDRLAMMFADSGAPVLLTEEHNLPLLPDAAAAALCIDRDAAAIAARPTTDPGARVRPENLGYVLYTSGSTGKPKGVALHHGALVNLLRWQIEVSPAGSAARTLQFGTLSFDQHFLDIFATLGCGGTVYMVPDALRRDAAALLHYLDKHEITRLFMPYVGLRQMAEVAAQIDLVPRALRLVISAGEQLQVTDEIRALFARLPGCVLCNQYGPAETQVITALDLTGAPEDWPFWPTVGKPVANNRAFILDRHMQPVPIGAVGELFLGGVHLARGYVDQPAMTVERFIGDPLSGIPGARLYRTGDLARHRPDGSIEYRGRNDHQVKIRGFRVEPGEIEAAMLQHAAVKQAVAGAREVRPGTKQLVAWVVPAAGAEVAPSELRRFLRELLPDYMLPAAIAVLDEMPQTATGKLDRRALPLPRAEGLSSERYVAPRNETERRLCVIWREVIEVQRVGVHDNFFELGGHSLLATKVISRIQSEYDMRLPLTYLFRHPTVAELAEEIDTIGWLTTDDATAGGDGPTDEGAL